MSGIFGIYYLDGRPADPEILAKMSTSLRHRGPDDEGTWRRGCVGLGHRMLWNTPESLRERQPLASSEGDIVLTADARIDNRDELIAALHLDNRPSNEVTDSELILSAYEKWGVRCSAQLLGDFAFAIWDGRKHEFFCARDHFGFKPFYYYLDSHLFVFASEIKAVLCVPDVPRRLNEVRVGDYLARNFEDKTITFYEGVQRLPQANQMTVGAKPAQDATKYVRCYWTPDLSQELHLRSDGDYVEAFREAFTAAVRCRVRSAFPVGSTLSGGVDSSSVACTAAKVLADEKAECLHTFSAIFPSLAEVDPRIDERRYIEAVLQHGEFRPHYIYADRLTPLVERFWQEDEVIVGINLYMDHAFFGVARQQGIRVLLTGHDGDSVVSHGYERLAELARTFKWMTLLDEATALAKSHGVGRKSILWKLVMKPVLEAAANVYEQWRSDHWESRRGSSWDTEMAINPAFAQRIGLTERVKALSSNGADWKHSVREQQWNGLNSGLFSYVMELLDKIAAPFAVEPRHPFFDKRVVELCLALPLEQKLQQGWTRAILRNSMTDLLPPEIQWRRSKGNLSANFHLGLAQREERTLQKVIFQNATVLEQYMSIPNLQRMYYQFKSHPFRCAQEAITVNGAVLLALWLTHSGADA